jgi:hypothetical protein
MAGNGLLLATRQRNADDSQKSNNTENQSAIHISALLKLFRNPNV